MNHRLSWRDTPTNGVRMFAMVGMNPWPDEPDELDEGGAVWGEGITGSAALRADDSICHLLMFSWGLNRVGNLSVTHG